MNVLRTRVGIVVIVISGGLLASCQSKPSIPNVREVPYAAGAALSIPYEYQLYTHCGIHSAKIDGRWWVFEGEPLSDGNGGAPPGWSDPYHAGLITLESRERATFSSSEKRLHFRPATENRPLKLCK